MHQTMSASIGKKRCEINGSLDGKQRGFYIPVHMKKPELQSSHVKFNNIVDREGH